MTRPYTTQDLAERLLHSILRGNPAVFLHVLRLLAEGRPVSVEEVANSLYSTPDEVTDELRQFSNIEFDERGNIVAAGLSLTPTPHHFQVHNVATAEFYAGADFFGSVPHIPLSPSLPGERGVNRLLIGFEG